MVIWKLGIPVQGSFELALPAGSRVLTVQAQGGDPYIWFLCDPLAKPETRRFSLVGTGHPIETVGDYLGTFQVLDGMFVGHLFEDTPDMSGEGREDG